MRWFKHLSTSHEDESLAVVLAEGGLEAYGFWWMMLEIIAKKVDEGDSCSVTFPLQTWCNLFGLREQKFNRLLRLFENTESFSKKNPLLFVERNGKLITVSCPNLSKYRDEYSRKKGKNPDSLRSLSGHCPEFVRSKESDTETDTETDTDRDREKEKNNPPSLPSVEKGGSVGDAAAPTESATNNPSQKSDSVPYEEIINAYHEILPSLPRCSVGREVRKHIRARWKENPERQHLGWWKDYFHRVRDQPFLIGSNDRGWVANLLWLVRPTNMEKVIDGVYRSRSPTTSDNNGGGDSGLVSPTTVRNVEVARQWLEKKKREMGLQ